MYDEETPLPLQHPPSQRSSPEAMTELLGDDTDPLDHLAADPLPPDPEEMLPLLQDPNPQQRMLAARAFCELQDDRAIDPLIALLQDTCPLIRVSAAYALGRNVSPKAIDPLITQLQQDWNGYVRKGLVWALGNGADPRCLGPLLHALKTDIAAVRLWAASALGQLAPAGYDTLIGAIPALIEGLRQDAIAVVRSNCAWSVGQLCRDLPSNIVYATAVDALIEAMVEDDDLSVREDAKAALLKLGDPRALKMIEDLQEDGLLW